MRVSGFVASVTLVVLFTASSTQAQVGTPGPNTVAIGAGVGFLAPDNESEAGARAFEDATATVEAFVDYYYDAHVSIRGTYGWAQPAFVNSADERLRRQHIAVSVSYGWPLGAFRPFVSAGGGAHFLSHRKGDDQVGDAVTKPGGLLSWGVEYYLRTFALRTEMNVHILGEEARLPGLGTRTATAFTWVFGVKIPL